MRRRAASDGPRPMLVTTEHCPRFGVGGALHEPCLWPLVPRVVPRLLLSRPRWQQRRVGLPHLGGQFAASRGEVDVGRVGFALPKGSRRAYLYVPC